MKRTIASNLSRELVTLGLTHQEASVYIALHSRGSLGASALAKMIAILPNAVYRLMRSLKEKGFVVFLDTHPATFQVIPPRIAIEAYVQKKQAKLEELKVSSVQALSGSMVQASQTHIDVIAGRREMFETYIKFLKKAKEEVLVISVGEEVPDELKLGNRDALERGVVIKFIPHQYNQRNKELLMSWVRLGIEIRHYSDSGFHLVVFDRRISILAVSNPQNVAERTSMVIHSTGLSRALSDYFYTVWEKAVPIEI